MDKPGFPGLTQKARSHHGTIFWLDETGIRSQDASGRSYAPKGHTPGITRTGQRFYCNVISALSNKGQLLFTVLEGNFNTNVFLEFLRRMVRTVSRKVFLITDSHPVDKARKVKIWLEQNKGRIELHELPAYAPQLNADEYFNQHLKSHGTGKQRPANKEQLIHIVRQFSGSVQRKPKMVRSFFNPASANYAKRYTKLGPD